MCNNFSIKRIHFVLDNDDQPNEGEIKCIQFFKSGTFHDCIVVSTDNDVIATSFLLSDKRMSVLSVMRTSLTEENRMLFNNQSIKKLLFKDDNLLTQWYGFILFAVFGGDYLPAFLASNSLKQMEIVCDLINDFKEELHSKFHHLDELFGDSKTLKTAIHLILRIFKFLTKHRRVGMVSDVDENFIISYIEDFFSDLLWVLGHYSCNINIAPNRSNFIVSTEVTAKSFSRIKNVVFKDDNLINKLDIDKIKLNALSETCCLDENWDNLDLFRNQVFSSAY